MADMLPESILLKPVGLSNQTYGYVYYLGGIDPNGVAGRVMCNGDSVFSPWASIEVEPAKVDDRYVHLKFRHNNKYISRLGSQHHVFQSDAVAISTQPDEDTSKETCTLFEPRLAEGRRVQLWHVQSRGHLSVNQRPPESRQVIVFPSGIVQIQFEVVNFETLVKLPKRVVFKGDNGMYLKAFQSDRNYVQFAETDPQNRYAEFQLDLQDDGHVRINNIHFDRYLVRGINNLILATAGNDTSDDIDTKFWPVSIGGSAYALRSPGNRNFLRRSLGGNPGNFMSASATTMIKETIMEIEELVRERHIYHIKFRMDEARIHDETPFIAGVGTSVNNTDEESTLSVTVSYEEKHSYSFNNSISHTSGTTTTITTGFPKIFSLGIEISNSETKGLEWGETVEETKKAEASVQVVVPPRSRVRVDYVGTQASCDIPFSYTQRDRSSTDGQFIVYNNIDGMFKGVNYHSFNFDHYKVEPIPPNQLLFS